MSHRKNYSDKEGECQVNVKVNVDVPKIVKYSCITGVMIVAIIFGTRLYKKMLEEGYVPFVRKK